MPFGANCEAMRSRAVAKAMAASFVWQPVLRSSKSEVEASLFDGMIKIIDWVVERRLSEEAIGKDGLYSFLTLYEASALEIIW